LVRTIFPDRSGGFRIFASPVSEEKVLYMFVVDGMPFLRQQLSLSGRCWTNDSSIYPEVLGRTDIPDSEHPSWICKTMYGGFHWSFAGDLFSDLESRDPKVEEVTVTVTVRSRWRSGSKVVKIESIDGDGLDAKLTVSVTDDQGRRRAARDIRVRSLLQGYDPAF